MLSCPPCVMVFLEYYTALGCTVRCTLMYRGELYALNNSDGVAPGYNTLYYSVIYDMLNRTGVPCSPVLR